MNKETKELLKNMGLVSSVGISVVLAIAIGVFSGLYLDRKFGTQPLLFFIFMFLGIIAGFRNVKLKRMKKVKTLNNENLFPVILKVSIVLVLLVTSLSAVLGHKDLSIGIFLGGFAVILNFILTNNSLKKALEKTDGASFYTLTRFVLRVLIVGIVALVAIANNINIIGLLIGFSTIVVSIFSLTFYMAITGGD